MLKDPQQIKTTGEDKHEWHVIIETPKGSCNKYKYDQELGVFMLARVLAEGLAFPFDFGFLPSTKGDDGDPLDVLLLMGQPTFCGCMVPSRLIGVIEAEQTERDGKSERNDRLLAVPITSRRYGDVRDSGDLDKQFFREVETFFATYNSESGKKFKVLDVHGRKRAAKLAEEGMKRFKSKRKGTKRNRK